MANILILYSTTDGHTRRICQSLAQRLGERGNSVTVQELQPAPAAELEPFDKLVIGAAIRYGHHRPAVRHFVSGHRRLLEAKPSAFFSVNLVARKPNRNRPETNPYLRRFLRRVRWQPTLAAVFPGRLDYPRYRWFDRWIIQFIMRLTGGPTDPRSVTEFTDWNAVTAFADAIHEMGT